MSIAYAGTKMDLIATKLLVQTGDKGSSFVGTDMPAAIAPHSPIADGYQIAAKNNLTFVDRDAHTVSLNGAPPSIIYPRVIT
jgi:hypothetical protein